MACFVGLLRKTVMNWSAFLLLMHDFLHSPIYLLSGSVVTSTHLESAVLLLFTTNRYFSFVCSFGLILY